MIPDSEFIKIASTYSTPAFLYDADLLNERIKSIKELLSTNVRLCYSIKANPFLIESLKEHVDAFEVCSPGELEIVKKLNVPGDAIIYSGVNKDTSDIKSALEYGVYEITAESLKHYRIIKECAHNATAPIRILLRLSAHNQFGMSKEDIESIISDSVNIPEISIVGIHYFAGTQRVKIKHQIDELDELLDYINYLRNTYNISLPRFEYGPGLSYPYFESDDYSDTLLPLKELNAKLTEVANSTKLCVEMGRFIASECGYYITRISDIKSSYEHNWCIVDGGINHVNYLGQMMGLKVPIISHLSPNSVKAGHNEEYTICGSLCTANDVLVRTLMLDNPQIGDLLVFKNIGAYSVTEGLNLFLSRNMPKVILYSEGECMLLRDTICTWELNS